MKKLLVVVGAILSGMVFGERIELKTASAACTVETMGARILSYRTADLGEMLWNAEPLQTSASDWAHGGIPVCWPYFGRNKEAGGIHGYAWTRPFAVVRRESSAAGSEVTLRLDVPEAALTYRIALSDESLSLRLITSNASDRVFAFFDAFHPYFRVGERDLTWLTGVKDEPFAVDGAIDGINPCDSAACKVVRIADRELDRTLSLACRNVSGICVWNPGAAKECPGAIPGDEWRRFVCVEPVAYNGEERKILLKPGEVHEFSFEIKPGKGGAK